MLFHFIILLIIVIYWCWLCYFCVKFPLSKAIDTYWPFVSGIVLLFSCPFTPPSPFTFSHHHYFRWFMNHVIIFSSYKTNKQKEMSSLTKYRCHLSQNTDVISHKIQMSSLTKFRCHLLQMSLSLYSYFYFFLLTCLWFIFCFLFDERQYLLIQYKFH